MLDVPFCLFLSFQEQYLFCYKVWLEVLQGILQLHGSQWQPESPRDHKVVWMFPPPVHLPVKHRLRLSNHVQSLTAQTGETFSFGCSLVSYNMKPVLLLCFDTLCWGLLFSDFNSFFLFLYVLSVLWLCQFNLDHWGCFAFSGLVICLLSLASFLNFVSLFECISFVFLRVC